MMAFEIKPGKIVFKIQLTNRDGSFKVAFPLTDLINFNLKCALFVSTYQRSVFFRLPFLTPCFNGNTQEPVTSTLIRREEMN